MAVKFQGGKAVPMENQRANEKAAADKAIGLLGKAFEQMAEAKKMIVQANSHDGLAAFIRMEQAGLDAIVKLRNVMRYQ